MFRYMIPGMLVASFLAPALHAQARGGMGRGVSPGFGHSAGLSARAVGRQGTAVFLGTPYFYGDGSALASPPDSANRPIMILQAMPPAQPAPEPPKLEPLLIELQGGRYVRVGEAAKADEKTSPASSANANATAAPGDGPSQIATELLPPAVLVYRDGHKEQVRDYTIANGALYARGNYWSDGYWNKKIPLASLNLPASLQASQKNGVKFVLPSSPNEVITRP